MRLLAIISVVWALLFTSAFSANKADSLEGYFWPLKLGIKFSSGFGDSRPGRFHMGVDLRTNSETGHKIYAPENGYVYRIKTAYDGYGKALYIKGESGRIYVFGHLQTYNMDIGTYLRRHQLENRRYYQDLYPGAGELPVSRGQFVARAGQTGIGAPHLHFEVRNSQDQPTNPLMYKGIKFTDKTPPEFEALWLKYVDKQSVFPDGGREIKLVPIKSQGGNYLIVDTIAVSGEVGFKAAVSDFLAAGSFRLGVRHLDFFIDNILYHQVTYDCLDFEENIYSLLDKDLNPDKKDYKQVYNLYRKPGNRLSCYKYDVTGTGTFGITEPGYHNYRIEAVDFFGNKATMTGTLHCIPETVFLAPFNLADISDSVLVLPMAEGIDDNDFDSVTVLSRGDGGISVRLFPKVEINEGKLLLSSSWLGVDDIEIEFYPPGQPVVVYHYSPVPVVPDGRKVVDSLFVDIEEDGLIFEALAPEAGINWLLGEIITDRGHQQFFYKKIGPRQFRLFYSPTDDVSRVDRIIVRGPVGFRPDTLATDIYVVRVGRNQKIALGNDLNLHFDRGDLFDDILICGRDTIIDVPTTGRYLAGPLVVDPPILNFADWADLQTVIDSGDNPVVCGLYVYNEKKGWQWAGGDYDSDDGQLHSKLGGAGIIAVISDTVAPVISKLNIANMESIKNSRPEITFIMEDELAKINNDLNFNVTIDDKIWLVPQFDPERSFFKTRPDKPLSTGRHQLKIEVTDRVGNRTVLEREFIIGIGK